MRAPPRGLRRTARLLGKLPTCWFPHRAGCAIWKRPPELQPAGPRGGGRPRRKCSGRAGGSGSRLQHRGCGSRQGTRNESRAGGRSGVRRCLAHQEVAPPAKAGGGDGVGPGGAVGARPGPSEGVCGRGGAAPGRDCGGRGAPVGSQSTVGEQRNFWGHRSLTPAASCLCFSSPCVWRAGPLRAGDRRGSSGFPLP